MSKVSKPRFGPKGAKAANVAPAKPTGAELVDYMILADLKRRDQSRERWALIEDLLRLEGYEVIADLFEHQIRRRR